MRIWSIAIAAALACAFTSRAAAQPPTPPIIDMHLHALAADAQGPRAGFHAYLRRIVEAGFSRRVMFGSDQMVWPEALEAAIQAVDSAPFLTAAEKRDIFYNNAARFLKLSETEIARHHGRN